MDAWYVLYRIYKKWDLFENIVKSQLQKASKQIFLLITFAEKESGFRFF